MDIQRQYYEMISCINAFVDKSENLIKPVHELILQQQKTIIAGLNDKKKSSNIPVNEKVDLIYTMSQIDTYFNSICKNIEYLRVITQMDMHSDGTCAE